MKQIYLITAIFLCCSFGRLNAQQVFSSAGGTAGENDAIVSYTIGNTFYVNNSGTSGTVVPGVQQPWIITDKTDVFEVSSQEIDCSIYPNPVADKLILRIDSDQLKGKEVTASLYNVSGNILMSAEVISDETSLDMTGIIPGNYLLKINTVDQLVRVYQIIKQ